MFKNINITEVFMIRYILAGILITTPVYAGELVFRFFNPSFSGDGWSSHVLTIENQEYSRKMKIYEEKKSL
jgi:hypothetical protein